MNIRSRPLLYLILPLVFAVLNTAAAYAIACPIACETGAAARTGEQMPTHEMACCRGKHCPMHNSNGNSSSNNPWGGQGGNCLNHCSPVSFIIPAAATVNHQAFAEFALTAGVLPLAGADLRPTSLHQSPPGLRRPVQGRELTSVLRI